MHMATEAVNLFPKSSSSKGLQMVRSLLRRTARHFGYDIHALPLSSPLTLRDLDGDLAYLVTAELPVIVDVGANHGQSIEAFLKVAPHARVVSFEANPRLAEILISKYRTDRRVLVRPVALGAAPGNITFKVYEDDQLSSVLAIDPSPQIFAGSALHHDVEVVQATLDEELRDVGRVDLLKIDTQGYDLQVLKGAQQLLSSKIVKLILVEVNFEHLYTDQCTFSDVQTFLQARGYGLLTLYETARVHDGCIAWATACFRLIDKVPDA
jgi:FkbM family methyltransferase